MAGARISLPNNKVECPPSTAWTVEYPDGTKLGVIEAISRLTPAEAEVSPGPPRYLPAGEGPSAQ